MASFRARLHRFMIRYREVRSYVGMGLDPTHRIELKKFIARHPHVFKWIELVDRGSDRWDSMTRPFRIKYAGFKDWLFQGPYRLDVNSLSRREVYDYDIILLDAAFQVLVDFVEKDLVYDADDDTWKDVGFKKPSHRKPNKRYKEVGAHHLYLHREFDVKHKELYALYNWWTKIGCKQRHAVETNLMASEDLCKRIIKNPASHQYYALEANYIHFASLEEELMLNRLMKIRNKLWT